jgi:rubrerythrin
MNITNELKTKLLAAGNAAEAAEIMKAQGQEITREEAELLFEEIGKYRVQDGMELDLDELEAVSGGNRNWVTEGCAGTVEFGSHCRSNDNCWLFTVNYDYEPTDHICPNCEQHMYFQNKIKEGPVTEWQYRCKFCGCIVVEQENDHEYEAGLR